MRKTALFLVIGLLTASSLACSLVTRAVERDTPLPLPEKSEQAAPTQPDSQVPPLDVEPTQGEPQDEPLPRDANRPALELESGLDELISYRTDFILDIAGQDANGEPKTGRLEILREVDLSNAAEHHRYSDSGDALQSGSPDGTTRDIYIIKGTAYYQNMGTSQPDACNSLTTNDAAGYDLGAFRVSDLIGEINGGRLVEENRDINGRPADVYAFTRENLTGQFAMYDDASGEYAIDRELGFLVMMNGQASGSQVLFGDATQGNITWTYTVDAVNQPVEISLPPACRSQQPAEDVPVPDEAVDVSRFSGTVTYSSPKPTNEVADFYRSQMPDLGWEALEGSSFPGMLMLSYQKEGRQLEILIVAEGEGSSVIITEAP